MGPKTSEKKSCRERGCGQKNTTGAYCRLHYIAHWQQSHNQKNKAREKMLDNYIQAITKQYPNRYLEVIKKDLSSEESFKKTLHELDLEGPVNGDILSDYEEILRKIKKD